MAIVNFYSIPELDMSYEHVPFFNGIAEQERWFLQKQKGSVEAKLAMDPSRIAVTIGQPYSFFKQYNIDYVSIIDNEFSRKTFYYFITNFEFKTSNATTLILALDVMQTYQTDIVFKDTFVERCHVDRWKRNKEGHLVPTDNYQDEGLQFGDLIITKEERTDFRDKYLITSSSPLGTNTWQHNIGGDIPYDPPADSDGQLPSDGDFRSAKVSSSLLRFIKPTEGCALEPYLDTLASKPVWTIGYGLTETSEPEIYNALKNTPDKNEKKCAIALYNTLNDRYAAKVKDQLLKEGINSQHEFDALISFGYNLGLGYLDPNNKLYSPTLWKAIRNYIAGGRKDKKPVKDAFALYNKSGGRVQPGLVTRRQREADMFCDGKYYNQDPIGYVNTKGVTTNKKVTENNGNGWLPVGGIIAPAPEEKPDGNTTFGHFTAYGHDFVYPGNGTVTSTWFRSDGKTVHGALDVGCPVGTKIHAARAGIVKYCQDDGRKGYGKWIQIDHGDIGLCTRYAHNSQLLVRIGQQVKQGEVIAISGNTGTSTGPHYHYELAKMPYVNNKDARMKPIPHLERGDKLNYW